MDYHGIYESLIRQAVRRGNVPNEYCEVHHIIPRSLGGSDKPSNLVELTFREHFLAHWLLSKMFSGSSARSMAHAFYMMSSRSAKRRLTASQFEAVKRAAIVSKKGQIKRREPIEFWMPAFEYFMFDRGYKFTIEDDTISAEELTYYYEEWKRSEQQNA